MKVVVVGGGIAGLAVASGLQRAGWETLVLERSADPQPPMAGLSIFGNGFRALDALGLGAAVRAISADAAPYQESGIRTPNGRWLVRFAPAASENLRAVDRTELHGVLLAALTPDSVQWGRRVSRVTFGSVEGAIEVAERSRITGADLIIGADGIRSCVRASLPQNRPTRYTGYGVWRAITSRPIPIQAGGETWGGRCFPLRSLIRRSVGSTLTCGTSPACLA